MKCKIVAQAEFDYEARTDEELTIREGTMLLVLDDSDPEWWLVKERVGSDAFSDGNQGLAPVNYLVEMEPLRVVTALYDYEARTDEELSFYEGATVLVYDTSDPEWWFVRIDKEAGLAPANYLEDFASDAAATVPSNFASSSIAGLSIAGDAAGQKATLLSALDGFGVSKAPPKPEKEKAPADVKLIDVFELDKKKKKERKECVIGIGNDYIVYLCEPIFSNVLEKWDFKEVTKFYEKKGKKLTIEFGSDVREFEGEKDNLDRLMKRLEEVSTLSKVSAPILTGPPPNMGPPSGSLTGFVSTPPQPPQPPQEVYTPPPAPIFITPSPAALRASALQAPPPIASGKSAIALYDYDATNEEEITIRENDELIVIDSSDDDWWNVRLVRSGQEGLVPKLYVELKSNSFALASGPSLAAPVAIDAQKRQDEQKIQEDQRKEDLRREEQRRDEQRREVQRREQERRGEEKRQIEADRKRAEDKARNTRMEEERRRHDEESQRKPTLLARPTQATTHAPPLPKRDDGPSQTISIPSAVPRLPERPAAPVSRPEEAKRQPTDKPNMAKVRKWVDKTGGFTVEAEFLNISEGKVHLHKVNGVKIAVPLEKLAPGEIEFIKTIPGYSSISVGGIVGVPTPGAARPRPGASSLLPASAYMYNGFDWRDWLLRAGVASTDAGEYALAFVREKLDKSVLDGVDRDVLKALGISEGDIIRIRKYAKTSISNGAGSKIAQKAKTGSSEKIDQILADEQYARQLQEQELHGNTGTTSALLKGGARGRPTGAGINSQAILAATSLLSTDRSGNSVPPAQQNINPWAGQNSNLGSNGSSTHTPTPVRQNSNSGALTAQQQLLNARQQEALNAQKQAELAAKQLYEQRAMAEQQTLLAARKAAELDQQKKQLELARMEAERNAQLQVMKNETARLEAQLAEQKKLAAMRPLQPALIPTPSGGPSLNFVPVSGRSVNAFGTQPGIMQSGNPQPQIISQQQGFQSVNAFGQQMIGGFQSQQSQNSNDKYAAFKDLDPMSQTSSVFSSSNSRSSQAFAVPQNQNFVIQQQQQQQQQLNSQVYNTNQGMLYGGGQIMQSGMSGGQQPGLMQPGFSSVNPIMAPLQPQQTGMMIGGNLTPQQLLYLQQQQQQQQQFGPR